MADELNRARKRRTVLWLFVEDYTYLSRVAEEDQETKNRSMHRLIKALRLAGITSFQQAEQLLASVSSGRFGADTTKNSER